MTWRTAVPRIGASRISACNGGILSMAIDQGVRAKKETRADAQSVIDLAHKQGLKIVDFKFIDLIGTWQHFSIPVQELTRGLFSEGIGFDGSSIRGFQHIHESDSVEGVWNSGKNSEPNQAYRPRYKEGYFPVPPTDKLQDLRSQIVLKLIEAGVDVEVHHHEVGTAGQTEIDMRFDTLVNMADKVMMYKYVVKNVCAQNGFVATFMPKPLFMDNGSGMHTHQSLCKNGAPLFYDKAGYAGISDMCRWYIGGLLKHAPSLLAFAAPTTNSYRRLVPGYEAPINLIYSKRNRSACVRIPMYFDDPKAKRLEFRTPDPSCNPYLSFAACLMAGLDGVINKIEPPKPIDEDLYELEPELKRQVKSTPGSLAEVLDALEIDNEYLTRGGVFTNDLIETWIDYKRVREYDQIALRPQ